MMGIFEFIKESMAKINISDEDLSAVALGEKTLVVKKSGAEVVSAESSNRPSIGVIEGRILHHSSQAKRLFEKMQLADSWDGENIDTETLSLFYMHEAVAKDLCWVMGYDFKKFTDFKEKYPERGSFYFSRENKPKKV